jgi:ubiquinone/menaquinone biosynthesis C-methylase UbiE
MDAENLQFDASSFDFVWSWGVIHHSSDTEAIVREVRRVLRPGGEFRCMVYNTYSLDALWRLARATLTGRLRPGTSVEALLRTSTDGWLARHFTSRTLAEMLENCGLSDIKVQVLGQRSELVPLPGSLGLLKEAVQRRLPDAVVRAILRHVGWYLLATAIKYEAP